MAFIATATLLAQLQARLESLPLDPAGPADGPRLFERVGVYGAAQMARALDATFASEDRVAFIVPSAERHASQRSGVSVLSVRESRVAVLIADRAFDLDRNDALVGGTHATGVVAIKDRIVDSLFDTPFAVSGLAFVPAEGEPLDITPKDHPSAALGREAYLLWLTAYAGLGRLAIP